MLKNKLKSLEKEVTKISRKKEFGVFFVDFDDGEYIVTNSGQEVFRGDKAGYEIFQKGYDNDNNLFVSFIIDDFTMESDESIETSKWAD